GSIMVLGFRSNALTQGINRGLTETSNRLSQITERLATGLRINSASEDPAGLAVSENLKRDSRTYTQAIRNISDGISALSIADAASAELSGIVTQIAELAAQAANGATTSAQRAALDAEAQLLAEEFQRIVDTTEFAGRKLLDGSVGELVIQAGITSDASSQINLAFSELGSHITGDGTFEDAVTFASFGGSTRGLK